MKLRPAGTFRPRRGNSDNSRIILLNNIDNDDRLWRTMREGDREAFAALYRRHADAVYRFVLMRTGSPHTAGDAVQDAFMLLMAPGCSFDPLKGTLPAFLFGVARNLILKRQSGDWRHDSLSAEDDGPDPAAALADEKADPQDRLIAAQDAGAVRGALQQLPPHYRDVLILYELHDMSYAEIAQVCGIDVGTVRSRLSRGRDRLGKALRAAGFGSAQAA
jgi:RNA polymerase sigma-70 factor (ECF subfamily)